MLIWADYGWAGFPLFPDEAASYAGKVDQLLLYLCIVCGAVGLLITALLVGFSIRYRRRTEADRTPRITGFPLLEWFWTIAPLVPFAGMFWWGVALFQDNFQPPADAYEVFVVGKQWMWKIQHPGGQREINELHLPLGRDVKVTFISEDVIHDFGIPAFRQKIDVLPGRYVSTWYRPTSAGRFHLFCNQYCGTGHADMVGWVVVQSADEYAIWLRDRAEGSPALEGRKLFMKLQCITCHSANPQARAPVLEGLYGSRVPLRGGGSVTADENYIRESILFPAAKIVQGWEPIMPTFQKQVSEEDLIRLAAYIRSLQRGQTPERTEEFPPPVGAPTGTEKKGQP